MVGWIALAVAVVFGVVLIGFCGYEIAWKFNRLRRDVSGLQRVNGELQQTKSELDALTTRLQAVTRHDS